MSDVCRPVAPEACGLDRLKRLQYIHFQNQKNPLGKRFRPSRRRPTKQPETPTLNASEPLVPNPVVPVPQLQVQRRWYSKETRSVRRTWSGKSLVIHPPSTSRRGNFGPSRRHFPARSGLKVERARPVVLVNVPHKRCCVEPRRGRRRVGPSKIGRFSAASHGCARRFAGANKRS